MKIKINNELVRRMLLVAGISLVLSGCGRDNTPDNISYTETQTEDDATLDPNYDDSYDEDSGKEDSEDELVSDDNEKEDSENYEMKEVLVSNAAELNDYFSDTVDFSDVRDAIYNNSNFTKKEKKYFLEFVDGLEEKAPTVDLRCLYENFKLLRVVKDGKTKNSRVQASFSKKKHEISMFQDQKFNYNHEVVHMLNTLWLPMEGEKFVLNRDFRLDQINSVSFLDEGFTAWFNDYLFGDEDGYPIQRSDMNIIQYILNLNDDEFIQMGIGENYTSIIDSLSQYLKAEEITKWMDISEQEKGDAIYFSQMKQKYSLLLKACIASKGGTIGSDELYQIMTLLSNSYNQYYDESRKKVTAMHHEFMKELRDRVDYTNNDIQILDMNKKPIAYCDTDQMYFIPMENGRVMFAEKYLDSQANERYYANAPYTPKENDIIISINELINYDAEYRDCYTVSELATIYSEYSQEYEVANYSGAYQKTP